MIKIAITLPEFYPEEEVAIQRVLENGFHRVHLRKPSATREEVVQLLEKIPETYYARIVLHDHFELALSYCLGGIHLNSRSHQIPDGFEGSISRSCHSLEEVVEGKKTCHYLFLSPIFDSISKQGYLSRFTRAELQEAANLGIIDRQVYALGGVTWERLPELSDLGFGGAAMMGSVW